MTRVIELTPPATGAVAVIALRGPAAWPLAREHFQPAGPPLPEQPVPGKFRFGRLGGDEVILAAKDAETVEFHCHGGRRVVESLIALFQQRGCERGDWREVSPAAGDPAAWALLPFARTFRTAAILLDQCHGAYRRTVERIDAGDPDSPALLADLRRFSAVGRHLTEPWKIAVAGKPNAGKSSLMNALAGYQRSVVTPIPGTTRDAVTVSLAFDGWPVDVTDTAGLRDSSDDVELEGIARARAAIRDSDLTIWLYDATAEEVPEVSVTPPALLCVANKIDLLAAPPAGVLGIAAVTGAGLPELIARVVGILVPETPPPGAAVPFTAGRINRWGLVPIS